MYVNHITLHFITLCSVDFIVQVLGNGNYSKISGKFSDKGCIYVFHACNWTIRLTYVAK